MHDGYHGYICSGNTNVCFSYIVVLLLADDSEEGTAYSSGACEFIPGFSGVQISQS